jgi:hypothetical protein
MDKYDDDINCVDVPFYSSIDFFLFLFSFFLCVFALQLRFLCIFQCEQHHCRMKMVRSSFSIVKSNKTSIHTHTHTHDLHPIYSCNIDYVFNIVIDPPTRLIDRHEWQHCQNGRSLSFSRLLPSNFNNNKNVRAPSNTHTYTVAFNNDDEYRFMSTSTDLTFGVSR